ncbi:MAG: hypothetical protein IKQ22_00815 [Clostridia bacterium]|nr:hypothetical protein [Clostridia bacterium]
MKKAWTPDHCPLQVGSVVYDPKMNADRMVVRRYLSYEDNHTDEEKNLVTLDSGMTYTGLDLMHLGFTYYPDWPCPLEEKPCYDEVEDEPIISNLVISIFDGLRSAHIAKEGVHYDKDGAINVWEDDLATAVNNAADDLAKIFKEYKHDEQ